MTIERRGGGKKGKGNLGVEGGLMRKAPRKGNTRRAEKGSQVKSFSSGGNWRAREGPERTISGSQVGTPS